MATMRERISLFLCLLAASAGCETNEHWIETAPEATLTRSCADIEGVELDSAAVGMWGTSLALRFDDIEVESWRGCWRYSDPKDGADARADLLLEPVGVTDSPGSEATVRIDANDVLTAHEDRSDGVLDFAVNGDIRMSVSGDFID